MLILFSKLASSFAISALAELIFDSCSAISLSYSFLLDEAADDAPSKVVWNEAQVPFWSVIPKAFCSDVFELRKASDSEISASYSSYAVSSHWDQAKSSRQVTGFDISQIFENKCFDLIFNPKFKDKSVWYSKGLLKIEQYGGIVKANKMGVVQDLRIIDEYEAKYKYYNKNRIHS